MTEKYVLEVNTDHETGEEHCTVLKTDGTTDMNNWITIINAMYTHHSILEPLVNELNKIYNGYSDTEKYAIKLWKENQQLKKENQRLSEQKHIYKQDWKHLCIDKELLDSENEQLKEHIKDLRLNVLDSIHEANEIQCSCNPCVVEMCVKKVVE